MTSTFLFVLALIATVVTGSDLRGNDQRQERSRTFRWSVKLTNMAYMQPFGPFFVLNHNSSAARVFSVGTVSSPALAVLAEDGSPMPLIASYNGTRGTKSAMAVGSGPLLPGQSFTFMAETSNMHPFISLASMAINTNDCFAGFNRIFPSSGLRIDSPGYDSGSETNDELCINIPGPGCSAFPKTNRTDLNDDGEGFVHVHRGMHGVGDLAASVYDWRNPMLRVEFQQMY
jgi:hypothetical protein